MYKCAVVHYCNGSRELKAQSLDGGECDKCWLCIKLVDSILHTILYQPARSELGKIYLLSTAGGKTSSN